MLLEKPILNQRHLSILIAVFTLHFGMTPTVAAADKAAAEATGLIGDWCLEKKRRVTHYKVVEGKLHIRSGRSGRLYQADLTCNEAFTQCEAKTIRGWGTPVTETLRLDGDNMNLTRVWGGSWKDKTYNFVFKRCPKW